MKYALALGALIGLAVAAPANATALPDPITVTYNVTLLSGISAVNNIMVIAKFGNEPAGAYGAAWGPGQFQLSPGQSTISVPLFFSTQNPLISTLALGWTSNLPGDPLGVETDHLVVFGDFSPGQIGQSYTSLFPDAEHESELLIDLKSIFANPSNYPPETIEDALNFDEFPLAQEAEALGMFAPVNSSVDAVAFSTSQLIGTGTVTAAAEPLPEPLTLSLFGTGLAGAFVMRRKKKLVVQISALD